MSIVVLLLAACNNSKQNNISTQQKKERIISLNGSITETLVALNHAQDIIAVDVTSTYPQYIKENATDLGHSSKVTVESILSLQPTTLYATRVDLTPESVEQLYKAGVNVEIIDQEFSLDGTKKMIEQIARSLNNTSYGELTKQIQEQYASITPIVDKPKVLFIYARGTSVLMVAGQNTPIDTMINLAGGQNAVQGFDNYKPLTPEALIQANPDYILLFTTGLQSLGQTQGILKIPGMDQTSAGKNQQIIAMDGQLLSGFGPRVGQGIIELNTLIQP